MKLIFAIVVSSLAITISLLGCTESKQSQASSPASPAQQASQSERFAGREFAVPLGWTTEKASGGLLLMAPQPEAGWQANVFLEEREDKENRSLQQAINDLMPNIKSRKQQFNELKRKFDKNPHGVQYGVLEYSCLDQGTELREWEVIIELTTTRRLFILASSASSRWTKYQPIFKSLIDSLQ